MSGDIKRLLDHLALIARELPPGTIKELTKAIESLSDSSRSRDLLGSAITARARTLYEQLVEAWSMHPEIQPRMVAIALESAYRTIDMVTREQMVDLLWTGPATSNMPMRRSDQGLYEIIDGAREEILVVSFAVHRASGVVDCLQKALERGVKVRFILEMSVESGGRLTVDIAETLKRLIPGATLLCWPMENRERDDRGRYGSLHAKCAVADRNVAFISSANLTEFAMELNMELGVLVRGGNLPKRIVSLFDELIARRILVDLQ